FARAATEELGAEPHQYPTLIDAATLDRCQYFTAFPHHLTFAPHVREELLAIEEVASSSAQSEQRFVAQLAPPTHLLSPAVCFHTYLWFKDRPLAGPT